MSKLDVLCAGLNTVDILFEKPSTYDKGEKHTVEDITLTGGAPAANAACVMAALGMKTGYLGYFGRNALSTIAVQELMDWGVVDDYFLFEQVAEPVLAVVEIDPSTGDRTVFFSTKKYRYLNAEDVPEDLGNKTKMLLLDGYDLSGNVPLLKAASEEGCLTILDLETGPPETLREMIRLGTDVIMPLAGAKTLSGEEQPENILKHLCENNETQLLITDGANGSWALDNDGQVIHQSAFPVEVVDTTGCGDAFHGAYAFGRLHGWSLKCRMEFAAFVAGMVAGVVGGRADLPIWPKLAKTDLSMLSEELLAQMKSFLL